jgi:hypothetical protein
MVNPFSPTSSLTFSSEKIADIIGGREEGIAAV